MRSMRRVLRQDMFTCDYARKSFDDTLAIARHTRMRERLLLAGMK